MSAPPRPAGRWPAAVLLVIGFAAGCGDKDKIGPTVPVNGTVTIDGAPVPVGNMVFKPDQSKGNTTLFEPVAFINPDGRYSAKTGDKDGAPPGWYQVAIEASAPAEGPASTVEPKSYIPRRYNTVNTSGLTVEVRADAPPGSYDFRLTSKKQ